MSQQNRRYPGLNYFTTEQKDRFFGRDDEREALLDLVQTEKIVVLFGKSGYGKSSLLRAGLIPDLPPQVQPVVIQLGAYQPGLSLTPLAQTLARLGQSLPDDATDTAFLEEIAPPDTLWLRFRRKQRDKKQQFLLLFDQFEEFDSYPAEQKTAFKEQLHELLFTRIPQAVRDRSDELPDEQQTLLARPCEVRALFAIREDRLSVLQALADKLPAILHKRYQLGGLNDRQAREAVLLPAALPEGFAAPAFRYEAAALEALLRGLKKDDAEPLIESFLLQICCEDIETRVIGGQIAPTGPAGEIAVKTADLPVFKTLFEQYYRNKIAALPDESARVAARRMIEDHLVKADPLSGIYYRVPVDRRSLLLQPHVDEDLLKRLTDAFLLRSEPNTTGGFSYEVSHDRLMEGILIAKKEYDEAEAEKLREQERLEAEQRAREAEAKAAEEKRRAEEAERLKNEALQGRRRARNLAWLAGGVAAAAIGLGVFAFFKQQEASAAKDRADGALAQADEQRNKAVASADSALAARQDALQQKDLAEKTLHDLKNEQRQKFRTQAEAARKEKRYAEALRAYQEALKLAAGNTEAQTLRKQIADTEREKNDYEFQRNKDVGLAMKEAGDCTGALFYLKKAAQSRNDPGVNAAIAECTKAQN